MDLRLGQLELDWHEAAPSSSSGASAVGFLITLFLAKMSSYDIACKIFSLTLSSVAVICLNHVFFLFL